MEVQEKNLMAAFDVADESGKKLLKTLFPDIDFERCIDDRPVTERVKTLEDAIEVLGYAHPLVAQYRCVADNFQYHPSNAFLFAVVSLQVVCAALNEGWEPQFTEDETRYYPWHWLYSESEIDNMNTEEQRERCMMSTGDYITEYAGFASADTSYAPSGTRTHIGSRLCLKNRELAAYCGTQFVHLWADFKLIRK